MDPAFILFLTYRSPVKWEPTILVNLSRFPQKGERKKKRTKDTSKYTEAFQKDKKFTSSTTTMVRGIASWRHSITQKASQLHLKVATRCISINHRSVPQEATSLSSSDANDSSDTLLNKTVTDSENIGQVTQLKPYQTLETAKFESLGTPPTILSIHSPPSVPIYLRRGSLLSIYGLKSTANSNNNSDKTGTFVDDGPIIRNTIEYPHLWKRLLLFGKFQSFQKLISTIPISLLISSKNKSSGHKAITTSSSFVNVILDGLNDWAILNKNAIQVYTGNSLLVSLHSLPRYISKKLAKQMNNGTQNSSGSKGTRVETGLRSLWNRGYTLLSGRGQVGLVGNGGIYQLDIGEHEEILINKWALLAITVNGPFDLENCVIKDTSTISQQSQLSVTSAPSAALSSSVTSSPLSSWWSRLLLLLLIKRSNNQVANHTTNTISTTTTKAPPTTASPTTSPTASPTASQIYHQFKYYTSKISHGTKSLISSIHKTYLKLRTKWTIFTLGTNDFVKIVGPRNVLVQSSFHTPNQRQQQHGGVYQLKKLQLLPSDTHEYVAVSLPSKKNPKDYLSYVTIDPEKGAVFANTPNFKQTVDEIERKQN